MEDKIKDEKIIDQVEKIGSADNGNIHLGEAQESL